MSLVVEGLDFRTGQSCAGLPATPALFPLFCDPRQAILPLILSLFTFRRESQPDFFMGLPSGIMFIMHLALGPVKPSEFNKWRLPLL